MTNTSLSGTVEIAVQNLPTGPVVFTSGSIGLRYVEAAEAERLRDALRETVDLCNALREYAPTLSMKAEKRLRDSLEALNG